MIRKFSDGRPVDAVVRVWRRNNVTVKIDIVIGTHCRGRTVA